MTILEFWNTHCPCGSQTCLGTEEDISYCIHYNGEIEGIPKRHIAWDLVNILLKEADMGWEELAKEVKEIVEKEKENE